MRKRLNRIIALLEYLCMAKYQDSLGAQRTVNPLPPPPPPPPDKD